MSRHRSGLLGRLTAGVVAGVAAVAYARAIKRRNRGLVRPRVRDALGNVLPQEVIEYSDGERVEFIDAGEGETLVWIPGADGPKETFRYQLPRFARDYRVLCADLRSRFQEDDDFDRFVQDLLELTEARGVDRFVVIGQSLGSAIAIRLAALFPERVSALILCNPVARVSYEHVGLNRTALTPLAMGTTRYLPTPLSRSLARVWSQLGIWIFDDSSGRDALIEYALFTGPRTVSEAVSDGRVDHLRGLDLTTELSQVRAPALVVKGPHDVYCPVSWALEIADGLRDATYVPIPGTGHCSHISRPGAFNQVLASWIAALGERDGADPEPTNTSPTEADA